MATYDPHLLDALEASSVESVHGVVWRQVLEPTSVLRPNQRGARWNSPGVEALYCSLHPATAAAEIDHLISVQPVQVARQRLTYSLKVTISRVVDLRPTPWGVEFSYVYNATDVEECQTIGAAASWLGSGGLLVPSQRADGDNLVIFMANLDIDDNVEVGSDAYEHPPGPPNGDWPPLAQAG